jgi:hypothetical protein
MIRRRVWNWLEKQRHHNERKKNYQIQLENTILTLTFLMPSCLFLMSARHV